LALLAAAIAPPVGSRFLLLVAPLLQRSGSVVAAMAARNIHRSLSRTGIALAALTVALSMSIAMGTMVSSFRAELHRWIDGAVQADVYISPATAEVNRDRATLDPALVQRLRTWRDVESLDTYRSVSAQLRGEPTRCAGIDISVYRRFSDPDLLDGTPPRDFYDRLEQGQTGVSETLARKWKLRSGDRISVEVAGQVVELRVAGIYRDYTSDRGVLLMDRRSFEMNFGARAPQGAALYARAGCDVNALVDELKTELGAEYAVLIRSNRDLRERAYLIFERTFRVARGLEVVGIAVAAIGILAALLALLLERGRELATLRSLGLEPRRLRTLLLSESAMIAGLAWLFALGTGSALSWILLRVINLRSFGWLLPFHVPWSDWILTLLWSLVAAALATWIPLRHSQRLSVSHALREE
jgi:putative ABC transport system permease protein